MSGKGKGRSRGRRQVNTKRASPRPLPVVPLATATSSYVPRDLCSHRLVQQGFAAFRARGAGAMPGAALISVAEAQVASPHTLAAESLVHAAEGWRFLSSALTALLAHGEKQAIHYAYYAELRAALSLLASYGLRVKYPNSTYLDVRGDEQSASWRKELTHKLVWRLWSDWARTSPAEDLFLDGLRVHPAVSLRHFKDAISTVSASANLTAWARDLQLDNEHTARNHASYEAGYSREDLRFMEASDFEFVRELWSLAEPTAVGLQFEVKLVRWMLKDSAENLSVGAGDAAQWISRVLTEVERLTGISVSELETVLSIKSESCPIFSMAFSPAVGAHNIASRAFFLLRLANLPIGSALAEDPSTVGRTWVRDWLAHSGLFDPTAGSSPADVWADYEHLAGLPNPPAPLPGGLLNDHDWARHTLRLGRPEAVMAWSLPL